MNYKNKLAELKQAVKNLKGNIKRYKYYYESDEFYAKQEGKRIGPFWLYYIHYGIFGTPIAYIEYKVCEWRGHKWVDLDPCDPEVGPQPHVECERCGKQM